MMFMQLTLRHSFKQEFQLQQGKIVWMHDDSALGAVVCTTKEIIQTEENCHKISQIAGQNFVKFTVSLEPSKSLTVYIAAPHIIAFTPAAAPQNGTRIILTRGEFSVTQDFKDVKTRLPKYYGG